MVQFKGVADQAAQFLQKEQLTDAKLWAKFVDVFRSRPDGENQGWRGEFWGKMMRGGALIYAYTQDQELYNVLTASVKDMMTTAEQDGRVSSYAREAEFDSWDIWCRKYVILACEYYLEICQDEDLKKEIVTFISRCADYIVAHIGNGEGQKRITDASRSWYGVNSSSVLEPIVRLYKLTGKQSYLDFATYIVNEGGARGINIFELAFENKLYPYQYGVSKAYEMISCFEGLLEYYDVTKIEKYKTAVLNFGKAVMSSEISIIGSCGITHELFDHTRTRQTVQQEDVMQETCVTVTWMKFCSRLLALTGDTSFADQMEHSFYNAYLGAFNTQHKESPYVFNKFRKLGIEPKSSYLPFDSYSPLTPGIRGVKVGGNQVLPDNSYYGCCACIGAAGVGVFLQHAVTADDEGIVINFFEQGAAKVTYKGVAVTLTMETDYPAHGNIKITVETDRPASFALKVRNPGWSDLPLGYTLYQKEWSRDTVELNFDMKIKTHLPERWEKDVVYTDMSNMQPGSHAAGPKTVYYNKKEADFVALTRGPLTLAADSRTGKPADSAFCFAPQGTLCAEKEIAPGVPCLVKLEFTDHTGEKFYLVDYASAGRDWETTIAAWLPTK